MLQKDLLRRIALCAAIAFAVAMLMSLVEYFAYWPPRWTLDLGVAALVGFALLGALYLAFVSLNAKRVAVVLFVALFSHGTTHAQNGSGLASPQACAPARLTEIAAHFGLSGDAALTRVADACAPAPRQIGANIVAFVVKPQDADEGKLYIAVLDGANGVTSSATVDVSEDAAMRFEKDSVRIDVAPYTLATDTRAFGLDLTSGYIPNCGDGGFGATRTLYARDGRTLRPVLVDLVMSEWTFVQSAQWRCNSDPNAPPTTIIEEFTRTIEVGETTTNGYRDLYINGRAQLRTIAEDGRETVAPSKRKPFRYRLQYDGQAYPTEAMDKAWWKWRD